MGRVISINRTPTDFVAKTRHLSLEDRGVYQELLDQIVILGQESEPPSLPDDDRFVANILGWTTRRWRTTKERLCTGEQAVLVAAGGRISQTRIVEEIEAARLRIEAASAAGKASASARKDLRERMLNARSTPVQRPLQQGFNDGTNDGGTPGATDRQRRGNAEATSHESRVTSYEEPTGTTSPPSPIGDVKQKRAREKNPSAQEAIEAFILGDDHRIWAAQNCPNVPVDVELEAWKDRCRANGYRTNAGPIRDPAGSWRTSMRNAEKWGSYAKQQGGGNGNGNGSGRGSHRGAEEARSNPRKPARDFGQETAEQLFARLEREGADV